MDITPVTFSFYLLTGLICIPVLYVSGAILRVLSTNFFPETKPYQFFISLIIGLTAWVSIYALVLTKGISIHFGYLVLALFTLFPLKGSLQQRLQRITPKELLTGPFSGGNALHYTGITLAILVLNMLIQYFFIHQCKNVILFGGDTLFYSKISEYLNITGIENVYNTYNLIDNTYHFVSPYHYYEIWMNALIYKFSGLHHTFSLQLICFPILFTLACTGLILYGISKKLKRLEILSLLIIIYTDPLNFLGKEELGGFIVVGISHNAKNLPAVLFIMIFMMELFDRKKISIIWLLAAALSSVALCPSVFGGILLFMLLSLVAGKNKLIIPTRDYILNAAILILYILFYFFFGNKNAQPESYLSLTLLKDHYHIVRNIFIGSGLYIAYLFSLSAAIILIFFFRFRKQFWQQRIFLFQVALFFFCLFLVADLIFGLVFALPDAIQFLSIVSIISISLIIIFIYVEGLVLLSGKTKQAFITLNVLIALAGVLHFYNFQLNLIYSGQHKDLSFVRSVLERRQQQDSHSSSLGFSLQRPEHMLNVYDKNVLAFCVGDFISMNGSGTGVVSLNGPDILIDSLEAFNALHEKITLQQNIFYRYYQKHPSQQTSLTDLRLAFIRKKKLSYGFFADSGLIPVNIKPLIKYQIVDSQTGLVYTELNIE